MKGRSSAATTTHTITKERERTKKAYPPIAEKNTSRMLSSKYISYEKRIEPPDALLHEKAECVRHNDASKKNAERHAFVRSKKRSSIPSTITKSAKNIATSPAVKVYSIVGVPVAAVGENVDTHVELA